MTAAASITFVLGGARSGKSRFAEDLAIRDGEAVYLATGTAGDDEMRARIDLHRARRGPGWSTVEEPLDLQAALARLARPGRPVLVDCLTLWVGNLMMADRDLDAETDALDRTLAAAAGPVVLVANEVGLGIVPDNALARTFRDVAGRLNQRVAARADTVFFLAAGLPLRLKPPA